MKVPVPLLLLLMTKNIQSTDQRLIADQKERKIPALTANEQTNISRKEKSCVCLFMHVLVRKREKKTLGVILLALLLYTKERIETEEEDRHKRKERQREMKTKQVRTESGKRRDRKKIY